MLCGVLEDLEKLPLDTLSEPMVRERERVDHTHRKTHRQAHCQNGHTC